jgi:hypothetical protein
MAVVAQLFQEPDSPVRRGLDRLQTRLDATIRDPSARPIDAVVHDLSTGGFKVQVAEALEIGSEVRLGLSGIGTSFARVMWRDGETYGCAFTSSIPTASIAAALHSRPDVPTRFPSVAAPLDADAEKAATELTNEKFPVAVRGLIIGGMSLGLWGAIIAAGLAIF